MHRHRIQTSHKGCHPPPRSVPVVPENDTEPYLVTREDLKETLEYVSGYSLYAYEDEIRQGFLSVQGGHRVGVTGKVILDGNRIRGMKYISCINVRLAHEIQGCADKVMPYIRTEKWVANTLIISPPRCGKTTLLRDIIRQLSNGWANTQGLTIGVVDERSELAGCYQGIPQNDLGMRTDVLDCCPKSEGMQMLVRSMSPDVVAVDELGCEEDFKAVDSVIHCGCKLIATAHGSCLEDVLDQPFFYKLMGEKVFERYIILDKNDQAGCLKADLPVKKSVSLFLRKTIQIQTLSGRFSEDCPKGIPCFFFHFLCRKYKKFSVLPFQFPGSTCKGIVQRFISITYFSS